MFFLGMICSEAVLVSSDVAVNGVPSKQLLAVLVGVTKYA